MIDRTRDPLDVERNAALERHGGRLTAHDGTVYVGTHIDTARSCLTLRRLIPKPRGKATRKRLKRLRREALARAQQRQTP